MIISDDGQRFGFNKRELAILTSVMAGEDRETFAAVWFHPSKAQAWATDGHRAVMVEREAKPPKAPAGSKSVALPAATAHHVAKTAAPKDVIVIDISGKSVAIEVREPKQVRTEIESFDQIDHQTTIKHSVACRRHRAELGSIDHFFPPFQGRGSKGAAVIINPALLRPLLQLGKLTNPVGNVWVNIGRTQDPAMFVARADPSTVWRMIVMPMRGEIQDHPDYGRGPAKPTRARASRSTGKKKTEPTASKPAASGNSPTSGPDLRAVS